MLALLAYVAAAVFFAFGLFGVDVGFNVLYAGLFCVALGLVLASAPPVSIQR